MWFNYLKAILEDSIYVLNICLLNTKNSSIIKNCVLCDELVTKNINKRNQLLHGADVTSSSSKDLTEGLQILLQTNES